MTSISSGLRAALATVLALMLPTLVKADPPVIKVRPDARSGDLFLDPANAHDNNVGSQSGASWSRSCNDQGTGTSTVATEYFEFGDVDELQQLVVKWDASASGVLWNSNNVLVATLKVEYSLNGGGAWQELDSYVFQLPAPSGGNPPSTGVVTKSVALPTGQAASSIRGRVTNRIDLACATGFNVGNLSAVLHVWDIRTEAPLPSLQLDPEPVIRGNTVTVSFDEPPRTEYLWWKFAATDGPTLARQYNVDSNEWSGVMVKSGVVLLRVTVAEDLFDLELPIEVEDRNWPAGVPDLYYDDQSNEFYSSGTHHLLSQPPEQKADLGISCPYPSVDPNYGLVSDDGPNGQWHYMSSVRLRK